MLATLFWNRVVKVYFSYGRHEKACVANYNSETNVFVSKNDNDGINCFKK